MLTDNTGDIAALKPCTLHAGRKTLSSVNFSGMHSYEIIGPAGIAVTAHPLYFQSSPGSLGSGTLSTLLLYQGCAALSLPTLTVGFQQASLQPAGHSMATPEVGLQFLAAIIGQAAPSTEDGVDMNQAARFDSVLSSLRDFKASPGEVTCRFNVTRAMQNRNGTLHGGCIGVPHQNSRAACEWAPRQATAVTAR